MNGHSCILICCAQMTAFIHYEAACLTTGHTPPSTHTHTPQSLFDSVKWTVERWAYRPGRLQPASCGASVHASVIMQSVHFISLIHSVHILPVSFTKTKDCKRALWAPWSQIDLRLCKKKKKGSGYKGMRGGLVVRCPDGFMSHHPHCSAHCSAAVMYDTSCKGINHHRVTLAKSLAFYRWRQASWLI